MVEFQQKRRIAMAICGMAGLGALLGGCSAASDMLSKDAEWFSRPKLFSDRTINASVPPLTPKPVSPDDLVAADGSCAGVAPRSPLDSNAMDVSGENGGGNAPPPVPGVGTPGGGVALEMTECEVVRSEGLASNVALGANERGDRTVVLTYLTGPRPGIYHFTSGRLTSIEAAAVPAPVKPVAKKKSRKK